MLALPPIIDLAAQPIAVPVPEVVDGAVVDDDARVDATLQPEIDGVTK